MSTIFQYHMLVEFIDTLIQIYKCITFQLSSPDRFLLLLLWPPSAQVILGNYIGVWNDQMDVSL